MGGCRHRSRVLCRPTVASVLCRALLCCAVQEGRKRFSAEPTPEDLELFWRKSPIAHVSKVQGPMIFMLGAKDRRVSQGRQGQAKGGGGTMVAVQGDGTLLLACGSEHMCVYERTKGRALT